MTRLVFRLGAVVTSMLIAFQPFTGWAQQPEIHCVMAAIPRLPNETPEADPLDPADEPVDLVPVGEMICVTDEALAWDIASQAGPIIGKHWVKEDHDGDSLVAHAPKGYSGCSSGVSFNTPTLPPKFDNAIKSAKAFNGCNTLDHYRYKEFRGSVATCYADCRTLGSMNGTPSSIKYRQ